MRWEEPFEVFLSHAAFPGGKDQAERVISATELEKRITTLAPVVYQRGGLPRPFRENSSWERLGA